MGGYLETINLTKVFETDPVVKQVSLSVEKGEIFSLLGGSGCGKSTLLRMLGGFEVPTEGSIFLAGEEIGLIPPYARPMNMMFQSYALFPHLNVFDNIAFGLRRESLSSAVVKARVKEMLELVELGAFDTRFPSQLSGGQQQRVALARSLAKKPEVLLLDEPLGALDKKLRERTQFELTKIIKQIGVTCLMVTHDQEEAMTMSHRIGVMNDGVLLQVGTPEEIYKNPNSLYVADFIGSVNLIEGDIVERDDASVTVKTSEGSFVCASSSAYTNNERVTLGLRPESIMVNPSTLDEALNSVTATVTDMAYIGAHTTLITRTKSGLTFKVNLPAAQTSGLGSILTGDGVRLSWTRDSAFLMSS